MCPLYGGCPLFRGFCFKFKFIDRDILRTIAPAVSHLLKRSTNKAAVEVIVAAVNRSAGYGIDFMAHKTTLIDSENLSCRRNRIAIFFNKLVLITCPRK